MPVIASHAAITKGRSFIVSDVPGLEFVNKFFGFHNQRLE
jgi:hypothetical protein